MADRPAGGAIDLSRGETGIGRRKLHIDRSELRRQARTAKRGLTAEFLLLLLRGAAADLQRRPIGPGRHAIDADALRPSCLASDFTKFIVAALVCA